MTYPRPRSLALWGCALLTGFLLAAPPPARAQAEHKTDTPDLDRSIGRVKQAVEAAEEKGKIDPPLAHALNKLIEALEEEKQTHHHRHHDEGTFASGYEQPGELPVATTNSTGNFDPAAGDAGDTADGGTDSGLGSGLSGGSMGGGAGSGSPATSGTGQNSSNKQSSGQHGHHHRHSAFAEGLRHAEHEWREWRREERWEHRMEHAFARGLRALRRSEEHAEHAEAKAAHAGKGSTGGNTAKAPRTGPGHSVGTKVTAAERHEHPWKPEDSKPAEGTRKMAANHPTGASGHPGGLTGQHPSTGHAPAGSTNHASPVAHAGTLVGTRHTNHKK